MATITERLSLIIDAASGGAIRQIKEVEAASSRAAAANEKLTTKTGLAQKAQELLGIQGVSTGKMLSAGLGVVGVSAVAALGSVVLDGVDKFEKLTGTVRQMQRVTGATAQDASILAYQMERLGIAPDAAASAIGRFAAKLGSGKVDLQQFGIEVQRNKDGTIDLTGTLENVAERFSKLKDPTDRATLGVQLFGKGWQTILPFLLQGKKGLQDIAAEAAKHNLIFNQDDLQKGKELSVATKDLKSAITGLEIELAKGLVPALADGVREAADFVSWMTKAADAVGGFKAIAKGLTFGGFGAGGSGIADAVAQEVKDKAQEKVNRLTREGKTNTDEYREAVKTLNGANAALAGSTNQAAGAQDNMNGKLATGAQKANDLFVANDKLANQGLGVIGAINNFAQSTADLTAKQTALNEAVRQYGPFSQEAAQAQRDFDAAQLATAQSSLDLDQKTNQLESDVRSGKVSVADMIGALERQKALHPEIAAAIQTEIDKLHFLAAASHIPDTSFSVHANTNQAEAALDRVLSKMHAVSSNQNFATSISQLGGVTNGTAVIPGFTYNIFTGQYEKTRAAGGPVSAMTQYLVGEKGPELFTPSVNGVITPNNRLGGTTVNRNYYVTVEAGMMTNAEVGSVVVDAVKAYERSNGSGWRN